MIMANHMHVQTQPRFTGFGPYQPKYNHRDSRSDRLQVTVEPTEVNQCMEPIFLLDDPSFPIANTGSDGCQQIQSRGWTGEHHTVDEMYQNKEARSTNWVRTWNLNAVFHNIDSQGGKTDRCADKQRI